MKLMTKFVAVSVIAALLASMPGIGCVEAFARTIETKASEHAVRGRDAARAGIDRLSTDIESVGMNAELAPIEPLTALTLSPRQDLAVLARAGANAVPMPQEAGARDQISARQSLNVAADRFVSHGAMGADVASAKTTQDSFYAGFGAHDDDGFVAAGSDKAGKTSALKRWALRAAAAGAASVPMAASAATRYRDGWMPTIEGSAYNQALVNGFFSIVGMVVGGLTIGILIKGYKVAAGKFGYETRPWQIASIKAVGMAAGIWAGYTFLPHLAGYLQAVMPHISTSFMPGWSIVGAFGGALVGLATPPQWLLGKKVADKLAIDRLSFMAYLATVGIVLSTWSSALTAAPYALIAIPAALSFVGSWLISKSANMPYVILKSGSDSAMLQLPAAVSLLSTLAFLSMTINFNFGMFAVLVVTGFTTAYAVAGYVLPRNADGEFDGQGGKLAGIVFLGSAIGAVAGLFAVVALVDILPSVTGWPGL